MPTMAWCLVLHACVALAELGLIAHHHVCAKQRWREAPCPNRCERVAEYRHADAATSISHAAQRCAAVSSVARVKHARLARIPVNAAPALARWRNSPGSQSFFMLAHDVPRCARDKPFALRGNKLQSPYIPGCAIHSCSPELELVGRKPFGLFHRRSCLGGERFSLAATRVTSPVLLRLRCATQNAALLSRYSSGSAATLVRWPEIRDQRLFAAASPTRPASQWRSSMALACSAACAVVPALTLTNADHACLSVRLT